MLASRLANGMTDDSTTALNGREPRWQASWLWGLALPAVVYLAQVAYLWGFTIDDVAITYRYALHLAHGQGLSWNPGGAPVEGYSNFLWVLILAGASWVGLSIETAAAALGAVLGLGCLSLLFVLCRRLWSPQRYWWLPVMLVSLTPEWTIWSVSGLEIPLYCAFLLVSLLGLTEKPDTRQRLLSIGLPGLVLTRPEGLLIGGIVLVVGVIAEPGSLSRRLRGFAIPVLATVATAGALVAFRLAYFGSPLPNTVYAKFAGTLPSLGRVGEWLVFGIPFFLAWGAALRQWQNLQHRWVLGTAIILVFIQIAVVLPVVPVMYFLHRYQIAFLPFLLLAVPCVIMLVPATRRWGVALLLALMLVWMLKEWPEVNNWVASERYWRQTRQEVADAMRAVPPDTKLALVDAGYIPYWSDLPTLDVWGLCDRRFAQEGFDAEATMAENPGVYVMPVDVINKGNLIPQQGRDKLVAGTIRFQERFSLWKFCGHPLQRGQPAANGYAIMLDTTTVWARKLVQTASP